MHVRGDLRLNSSPGLVPVFVLTMASVCTVRSEAGGAWTNGRSCAWEAEHACPKHTSLCVWLDWPSLQPTCSFQHAHKPVPGFITTVSLIPWRRSGISRPAGRSHSGGRSSMATGQDAIIGAGRAALVRYACRCPDLPCRVSMPRAQLEQIAPGLRWPQQIPPTPIPADLQKPRSPEESASPAVRRRILTSTSPPSHDQYASQVGKSFARGGFPDLASSGNWLASCRGTAGDVLVGSDDRTAGDADPLVAICNSAGMDGGWYFLATKTSSIARVCAPVGILTLQGHSEKHRPPMPILARPAPMMPLAVAIDAAVHLWDLPAGSEIPCCSPGLARRVVFEPQGRLCGKCERAWVQRWPPTIRHECFGNAARASQAIESAIRPAPLPLTDVHTWPSRRIPTSPLVMI